MSLRARFNRFFRRDAAGQTLPWLRVIAVIAVLALGMALGRIAQGNEVVRQLVTRYGYFGVFAVALVSGFNLVVPVPAVAFIPLFVASGLDLTATVAVIVVGVTIADMLAFMLGRAGRDLRVMQETRFVKQLQKFRQRHYWLPLGTMFLYASFAPLPNELMAIPLGLMGYPARHIFLPLLFGNLVFNTITAFGMAALFRSL